MIEGTIGGAPLVVLYARGVASALDERSIADSRDVGTVGVFDPRLAGHTLRFTPVGDAGFRDQTGTTWDVTGRAVDGPKCGSQLQALRHDEQFWFALAAFVPRARLLVDR